MKEVKVPITRFRRELRKWIRKQETVIITRRGVPVAVMLPVERYDEMVHTIKEYADLAQLASAAAL